MSSSNLKLRIMNIGNIVLSVACVNSIIPANKIRSPRARKTLEKHTGSHGGCSNDSILGEGGYIMQ